VVNSEWAQDVYLSPGDAGRFFACAVEAANVRFAIVFATSKPRHRVHLDLGSARDVVGFEPMDTWPDGIEASMLAAAERTSHI
jgi:hypothetical protein